MHFSAHNNFKTETITRNGGGIELECESKSGCYDPLVREMTVEPNVLVA